MGAEGILLLKVTVTPALVLAASLAGRHWGQAVGGWLVGLPLTSGPLAFFLAIDQGGGFVEAAALGVLGGAAAQGGFCVAYARAAARFSWPLSLGIALVVFGLIGALIRALQMSFAPMVVVVFAMLLVSVRLMPRRRSESSRGFVHPNWDLPARMTVATTIVVVLTALAPMTGPWLSGALATIPVFGGVLTAFAHRHHGSEAALQVLWGFLLGVFAVVGFFFALGTLIVQVGLITAFVAAIALALVIQGVTFTVMRGS